MLDIAALNFEKGAGLVTVVAQDARTGAVLMVAHADREALERTLGDRNLRLNKLGEEAAELVTACADGDRARAAEEGADVVYHTLVALRALGVTLDDLRRVLLARQAP